MRKMVLLAFLCMSVAPAASWGQWYPVTAPAPTPTPVPAPPLGHTGPIYEYQRALLDNSLTATWAFANEQALQCAVLVPEVVELLTKLSASLYDIQAIVDVPGATFEMVIPLFRSDVIPVFDLLMTYSGRYACQPAHNLATPLLEVMINLGMVIIG